ncbi:hypothetical protein GCM10027059_10550 [Myceligenerans halotolerans]
MQVERSEARHRVRIHLVGNDMGKAQVIVITGLGHGGHARHRSGKCAFHAQMPRRSGIRMPAGRAAAFLPSSGGSAARAGRECGRPGETTGPGLTGSDNLGA